MMIDNIDFQQAINMKKKLFIDCFEQANQLSNAKQLPIMIFDNEDSLVGTYYSVKAFKRHCEQFKQLRDEILKLQQSLRSYDDK